jgi:transcription termination/antitermination protein NusA
MNAAELKAFMVQVSREKELDILVVKDAIEQAIISASKKNLAQFVDARPDLDVETGQLRLYVTKNIVNIATNSRTQISVREAQKIRKGSQIGETVEAEVDPAVLGRIAAQSARQMVMQKLREAERNKVYDEFHTKVGEVVSGIVQRYEKRDLIIAVGKAEAVLPRNEIPETSHYRVNDRIKVYVLEINPDAKGPIIKVSRTHPQLVAKLFEQEVPEIADGTVKVVSVVREPGARAKIAVQSTNPDVDPVGACVGVKGSRVQMIVRELENEKIDIVPYNTNPRQFITNALVPAQIQSIKIDEATKRAEVTVKKGNLSLAIGKKGQNARLANRLTGWRLDIHSEGEEEKLAEANQEEIQLKYLEDFLGQMEGISSSIAEQLAKSPYNSVQALAEADANALEPFVGDNRQFAVDIIDAAKGYLEDLREMTRSDYGDETENRQPTETEE